MHNNRSRPTHCCSFPASWEEQEFLRWPSFESGLLLWCDSAGVRFVRVDDDEVVVMYQLLLLYVKEVNAVGTFLFVSNLFEFANTGSRLLLIICNY